MQTTADNRTQPAELRVEVREIAGGISYALYLVNVTTGRDVFLDAQPQRGRNDGRKAMTNLGEAIADVLGGVPVVQVGGR